jgi:hypothetical protein
MVLGLDWNKPILNRVGPRHDTIKCVMLAGSGRDTIKWVMSRASPLGTTYFAIYSPVPPPSLFSILQAWIKRERKLHPISLHHIPRRLSYAPLFSQSRHIAVQHL